MTLSSLAGILKPISEDDADYEARLLFSRYGGFSFAELLAKNPDFDSKELKEAIERRLNYEPLAYILGDTEFYSEKYYVSPECLIPRKDTEIIVEYAIKNLPENAFFADLCTGSGCIAISILAHRPDCRALAFDISNGALELARKNAKLNGVDERIEFILKNILEGVSFQNKLDAIISNPPYIRTDVLSSLSNEVKHEPMLALDGGADGMDFYRQIVSLYSGELKKDGFFLFETGYDQKDSIVSLAKENNYSCKCINDYGKNHRGAILKKLIEI